MTGLLPTDSTAEPESTPRVVDEDDEFGAVVAALKSRTARDILTALHEEPAPASALADSVDTSTQNVQYHLRRLRVRDLVTVADTRYSEKGCEMDVFAPAADPLVLFVGQDDDASMVQRAIGRLTSG